MSEAAPVILTTPVGGRPNLEGFDPPVWPAVEPREGCRPKWSIVSCDCEARVYRQGCNKLSCPTCEPDLRHRRAAAIRDRFERVRGARPAIYTVLTVPPELRERAADPDTWNKWRRKIWRWLERHCGGLFAVERTDPAGDRDRGLWHPHLNLLWMQRDGWTGHVDAERLRAAWASVIGAQRKVSVWTRYSADKRRVGHWYWYMGRTWPEWAAVVKRHLTVRWLGDYPRQACKLEPAADRELACECVRARGCRTCGKRYIFLEVGDKLAAEELAALGPAAVEREFIWREGDRILKSGSFRREEDAA